MQKTNYEVELEQSLERACADRDWYCDGCQQLQTAFAASQQRNRELTRQVEQLQARLDAAEKDVRRYQWLREHVKPWEGFDAGYPYCEIDIYLRELENGGVEQVSIIGPRDCVGMASLDTAVDIALAALTAPPSSAPTDPGEMTNGNG